MRGVNFREYFNSGRQITGILWRLTVSVTIQEIEVFIRESFRRQNLPLARSSRVLISQLAHMPDYGGMNQPFQFVEREIAHLEGMHGTQTKPAMPFNEKGKLHGFMHKHFWVPGYEHLGINAQIAWELFSGNSKKFSEMALRIAKPYATNGENTLEEKRKFSGELTQEFMYGKGGLLERFNNGKGTGDWLIFVEYDGNKYYLCIAKHDEDEFILHALKSCILDFPFLETMLVDR